MSVTATTKTLIDCSVTVLQPEVRDATGTVIQPPVLSLPSVTEVPLTTDELAQQQTDQDAYVLAQQDAAASAVAAAWIRLRMIRDRWLDQCQIIFAQIDGANIGTLPPAIDTAITTSAAAWGAWRQAMRDLPANVTDPVAAVAASADVHSTTDTWPAPWPQPPAAPVKHLT